MKILPVTILVANCNRREIKLLLVNNFNTNICFVLEVDDYSFSYLPNEASNSSGHYCKPYQPEKETLSIHSAQIISVYYYVNKQDHLIFLLKGS